MVHFFLIRIALRFRLNKICCIYIIVYSNSPHSIEPILGSINGYHRGAGVGFGHTSVLLEDDYLGPDLVVDLLPLGQNLIDVVLRKVINNKESINFK